MAAVLREIANLHGFAVGYGSRIRLRLSREDAQKCRFARAIVTDNADSIVTRYGQIKVPNIRLSIPALAQSGHFDGLFAKARGNRLHFYLTVFFLHGLAG